jgi:hypothetical protein
MKKDRKLVFKKRTLRDLTPQEASAVVGGTNYTDGVCGCTDEQNCTLSCYGTCGYTCGCSGNCDSQNCDTYVGCPTFAHCTE